MLPGILEEYLASDSILSPRKVRVLGQEPQPRYRRKRNEKEGRSTPRFLPQDLRT